MTLPTDDTQHHPPVALLGLGNMGQALCLALAAGVPKLHVWNRNSAKAAPVAHLATVAPTPAECVEHSALVVACLSDYDVTQNVLDQPEVRDALRGKTFVQLASGTPEQAQSLAQWCADNAVEYLDGKIYTYPSRIGAAQSVIGYSGGSAALYERFAPTLALLAGSSAYLSAQPGAAAVIDTAWLATLYGATMGILQGAAYCRAHSVDITAMFPLVNGWLHEIDCEADYYHQLLERNDFAGDQATIDVHLAAAQHLLDTARSHPSLTDHFPSYLVQIFTSLSASGHGDLEIAAAIKEFEQ